MVTENIMMYCTKKGGDRQELHEAIRRHSVEATKQIKLNGADNDLFQRILADSVFDLTEEELNSLATADGLCGRAKEQTEEYLSEVIEPILAQNKDSVGVDASVNI